MCARHSSALFGSLVLAVLAASPVAAQDGGPTGDPLPGLSESELARFLAGRDAFLEEEGAGDGLGPVFTEASCATCHTAPAVGGGSTIVETRIGRRVNGRFDPMLEYGGPIVQSKGVGEGVGFNGPYSFVGEVVPPEATIRAGRRSTPLFGLGLVEAVPDETFVQLAAFQQWTSPSTAGTPHIVRRLDTREFAVGRFGWKAQLATLFEFAGDAYTNEMGITTPLVPDENPPQGDWDALTFNPLPNGIPNEPDNEDLVLFSDFMRFLAPPPRAESSPRVRAGERVFHAVGCASCHVPTLQTGPNLVAALDRVTFHPYSDFLLHNMGQLGDGIQQHHAGPKEMRTAPLWGVSHQERLLHDGRALTLEEAIVAHDGQGRFSRQQFLKLSDRERQSLFAFLRSL